MSCITCQRVCPVPICTTTIRVGTVPLLATAVNVWIENARGNRIIVPVTTGAGGEVDLLMAEPDSEFWQVGFDYKLWVVDASETNIYDLQTISFADTPVTGTTATCALFEVVQGLDEDFDQKALSMVELTTVVV